MGFQCGCQALLLALLAALACSMPSSMSNAAKYGTGGFGDLIAAMSDMSCAADT